MKGQEKSKFSPCPLLLALNKRSEQTYETMDWWSKRKQSEEGNVVLS